MQAGYTVVSDVSVDSIHQAPSKALVGCDALIFDVFLFPFPTRSAA